MSDAECLYRIMCTVCQKGTLVSAQGPSFGEEAVAMFTKLSRDAGLIEIPSAVHVAFPDQLATVFVCSDVCKLLYEQEVGPERLRRHRIYTGEHGVDPVRTAVTLAGGSVKGNGK
jgi:hypothetical protein